MTIFSKGKIQWGSITINLQISTGDDTVLLSCWWKHFSVKINFFIRNTIHNNNLHCSKEQNSCSRKTQYRILEYYYVWSAPYRCRYQLDRGWMHTCTEQSPLTYLYIATNSLSVLRKNIYFSIQKSIWNIYVSYMFASEQYIFFY